jgi:hypothetical protein
LAEATESGYNRAEFFRGVFAYQCEHAEATRCQGTSVGLSDNSVVVAAKDQVSCDLGGEAAILSIKNGVYYGLDPVGARVWKLMQTPVTVRALREAMQGEYDVQPDRCESDLMALLEKMSAEGLIQLIQATDNSAE